MKKQLPTGAITNELSGASAFFKPQTTPTPHSKPPVVQKPSDSGSATAQPQAQSSAANRSDQQAYREGVKQSIAHDTVIPRHHDTTVSSQHGPAMATEHSTIAPATVEHIRKAVRQFGKEAATHRFTQEEKRLLADIVYTYERRGYRTSENEITRIAIQWLMLDYQADGEASVLGRVLEVLHR